MDDVKLAAIQDIVITIRKLVSAVHLSSSRMKKKSGLTGPQAEALRILAKDGPLSSAALSRKLFVTPSNITGIIDRLEKKGLVERIRGTKDRRISQLKITDAGSELSESLPSSLEGTLINGLLDMEVEEIRELGSHMKKIPELLQLPDSAPQVLTVESQPHFVEGAEKKRVFSE